MPRIVVLADGADPTGTIGSASGSMAQLGDKCLVRPRRRVIIERQRLGGTAPPFSDSERRNVVAKSDGNVPVAKRGPLEGIKRYPLVGSCMDLVDPVGIGLG
jgi:hypothetical protein